MNLTTRWSVKCPACNAMPHEPCMGSTRPRKSVHIERWERRQSLIRKRKEKQ